MGRVHFTTTNKLMEYVYCDNCKRVVSYKVDFLPANDRNLHGAQDIVCDECSFSIATFHERMKVKIMECGHSSSFLVEREVTNIEKNEGPLDDTERCLACAKDLAPSSTKAGCVHQQRESERQLLTRLDEGGEEKEP